MIVRVVKLTIANGKLDEFKSVYETAMDNIRGFDGCKHLELLENSSQNILMTYSYWVSEEHLEKYRNSTLFKSTWSKVKPLFGDKPEAWSLTKVYEN